MDRTSSLNLKSTAPLCFEMGEIRGLSIWRAGPHAVLQYHNNIDQPDDCKLLSKHACAEEVLEELWQHNLEESVTDMQIANSVSSEEPREANINRQDYNLHQSLRETSDLFIASIPTIMPTVKTSPPLTSVYSISGKRYVAPTMSPSSSAPTITAIPTKRPERTNVPSTTPSKKSASMRQTISPSISLSPSQMPSNLLSAVPTTKVTKKPTIKGTKKPSRVPSPLPTAKTSTHPTATPTISSSSIPSTTIPTCSSFLPTMESDSGGLNVKKRTRQPRSSVPTTAPGPTYPSTIQPTIFPTTPTPTTPTYMPTTKPTVEPTVEPVPEVQTIESRTTESSFNNTNGD
eukprot:gene33386-43163_t